MQYDVPMCKRLEPWRFFPYFLVSAIEIYEYRWEISSFVNICSEFSLKHINLTWNRFIKGSCSFKDLTIIKI